MENWLELASQMTSSLEGMDVKSTSFKAIEIDNDEMKSLLSSINESEISSDEEPTSSSSDWFENICQKVSQTSGLDQSEVENTVRSLLTSDISDEELQENLIAVVGFDHLDSVIELLQNRDNVPQEPVKLMSQAELNEKRRQNELERKERNANLKYAIKDPKYPHVYRRDDGGSTVSAFGTKYALPVGTERTRIDNLYEQVTIPHSLQKPFPVQLVAISELDFLCRKTFQNYETLNKMQSLVYPVGYGTNENMLVCAPTGAGKTDVAMLTILNTIRQHSEMLDENTISVNHDDFKIVYIAPLKALAAEIVEKFSSKLAWLNINVKELTGDMQLTRDEIMSTQIIVTTPEKWDVVTRKATGDNEIIKRLQLLIIDEVHLLHEERGAVIEALVARTLRQVESSQSLIRIVGLSATLPNFIDVAEFLRVNKEQGLFYFDSSFRPVPLKQVFIGAVGKAGSRVAQQNIDEIAYQKLMENLADGLQVMVFVHSRKDTVKTARTFMNKAALNNELDLLDCSNAPGYSNASREMSKWKNRDMRELFNAGFGVHHAGMLRSERNQTEKLFASGAIKVLCCTATLAWGVNLPAAVVIIKGTQVYDPKKGGFTDLGISDVIQIFGRAGRPQFEKFGTGILCTTGDKLADYLGAITQQHPIESKLLPKVVDNLNAEISLGTVNSVTEAVTWLGYTYLYVRMRKNPLAYGMDWSEIANDPILIEQRRKLVISAAQRLQEVQMIIFDEVTETLSSKDTGRIASDFYLLHTSVEVFNTLMRPEATEADVLAMLSMSGEFDALKVREEDKKELEKLLNDDTAPCQVVDPDSAAGKTNILLQAYISNAVIGDASLSSDTNYVAQNSIRIARALFNVALNRRWGNLARILLSVCHSIDNRLWPFEHPLKQFGLNHQTERILADKNPSIIQLREMEIQEIGELIRNQKDAKAVARFADILPLLHLEVDVAPITPSVLKVHIEVEPDFKWDVRHHGRAQFFWILVENGDDGALLHFTRLFLSRGQMEEPHMLDFTVPLSDPMPSQIVIRALSDSFSGAETSMAVSFEHLVRPQMEAIETKLLKLRPLPVTVLKNPAAESLYPFEYFNPMQSMVFHSIYHNDTNILLGSPTGSGKTIAAEIAIWAAFRDHPDSKIVYIAPMKALVRERVDDWGKKLGKVGIKLVEMTGDNNVEAREIKEANIIITTPEKFDGISRNWQTRTFVQQVSLIIFDEIHLLASDRGPILEMIVSRMNFVGESIKRKVRLMGMSTAVANAFDLASWLGVKEGAGLFNFPSSVRPVPLEMYIEGFQDNMGFCPLMKTMNKPTFNAIKSHSPNKPVLVFVASRRQTRLTAQDLIQLCGMEENPRRFLRMDDDELENAVSAANDETLKLSLQFGIALHHAGLVEGDRKLSHHLFASNKVQILVATSTLAWGVNLPAHLVVIKGTQFFDKKIDGYKDMDLTDVLQMMGRAGRPAFDTSGKAIVFTKNSTKDFYKYFLNRGFPVESSLHKCLEDHLGAEITAGTVKTKQQALGFLTWTFLFRRLHNNPTYYGVEDLSGEAMSEWISDLIDKTIINLAESGCVDVQGDDLEATKFLKIASFYYLSHKTMRMFLAKIKEGASMEDVLVWMCSAAEYDDLAIRHGEDILNAELEKECKYPASSMDFRLIDQHTKAFLLVQAHMSHVELPIADYVQDTVTVLDQSLRILQALVEVSVHRGFLSTTLRIVELMQNIKQASWDASPEAIRSKKIKSTLPYLETGIFEGELVATHVNPPFGKNWAVSSRFHKPQKEGWFLFFVRGDNIIGFKRWTPAKVMTCDIPSGCTVHIVNDAWRISYEVENVAIA